LQAAVDDTLSRTGRRLALTSPAKLPAGVRQALALFDAYHGPRLLAEHKQLADGGPTTTAATELPVIMQRTILREALADLKVLDLVQMRIDPTTSNSVLIPYTTRRVGTVQNNGVVYEGQGIPRAGFNLNSDTAYVLPMKMSFTISNELIHFFGAAGFLSAPDAMAECVSSNAQFMRELLCCRIANEMQRSADAYTAVAVSAENVASQLDGSTSLLKTAAWPIVRPYQVRDLRGTAINDPQNPITFILNDTAIAEWDGTGEQAAGTYFTIESPNLGLIRLVDPAGEPVTPTATGACALSYSRAANCAKFDAKVPDGSDLETHLNGGLRAMGARKAYLSGKQFSLPDAALMSPTLNDMLTNAKGFVSSWARTGTELSLGGDLEMIKSVPCYSTNAPGIDLGDERVLLLPAGVLSYVITKPLTPSQPFEAVGDTGRPTGEKIAYSEEYSAVHIPAPLRARLSSVIVYDSDVRAAAA